MKAHIITASLIANAISMSSLSMSSLAAAPDDALPKLQFPLDCVLGTNCWVARYHDRQPGEGKADYKCGRRTQHAHRGTDFVISNYDLMEKGVAILSVLDGEVLRLRDGVKDQVVTKENSAEIAKKQCGNAVIIRHEGGLESQYCHMKNGSLEVQVGDQIKAGDKIGEVGLSGMTEYPHLHFGLRRNGKLTDPFDGQTAETACKSGGAQMWANPIPYKELTLMPASFGTERPTRQTRWNKQQETLKSDAPALILTGTAWNTLKGDRWLFQIYRPDGVVELESGLTSEHNRQSQWYFRGKKRPNGGFMTGTWKGRILIIRQNLDGSIQKYEQETEIEVVD